MANITVSNTIDTFLKAADAAAAKTAIGANISNPEVAYVRTNGNDSIAEIGNPAKPFLTGNAALIALAEETYASLIFGVGEFTLSNVWSLGFTDVFIRGQGIAATTVDVVGVGESGTAAIDGTLANPNGGDGGPGGGLATCRFSSDQSSTINFNLQGGNGANGGSGFDTGEVGTDGSGGDGGNGGSVQAMSLKGIYGQVTINPGIAGLGGEALGAGGADGLSGVDGTVAYCTLQFCNVSTSGATETIAQLTILNGTPCLDN